MDHPSPNTMWRYAVADLPTRRRRTVREHALHCDTCRRELARNLVARRALGGDALRPSSDELAVWEAEILGRTAGGHRRTVWWGGLVAVLAAAAAAVVLMPRAADDGLTARGGVEPALAMRVLCVDATGTDPRVLEPPCPIGSYLKVISGRIDTTRSRFAIVGVSTTGTLWHLYPSEGERLLPLSTELAPLPGSFLLAPERRGALRVVLIASDAEYLPGDHPVWRWARRAPPGDYRDVLGEHDAVVVELEVGGVP